LKITLRTPKGESGGKGSQMVIYFYRKKRQILYLSQDQEKDLVNIVSPFKQESQIMKKD